MSQAAVPGRLRAHPDTSTIFVLGLLGLTPTLVFGICAWVFGNRLLTRYDAHPGRWGYRGVVEAGRILGMVGVLLSVVVIGFWIATLVF